MSLRLRLVALWTPKPVLLRELDRVAELTISDLDSLLQERAQGTLSKIRGEDPPITGNLAERRAAMATAQNARIAALFDALGDEAVRIGRERLFKTGERLGREARSRLGVGEGLGDLLLAARVLYRVLGIDFDVKWEGRGRAVIQIDRCALAEHYSPQTCLILSAVDEGVVRGLNPGVRMSFEKRMTEGCPRCIARLTLD